MARADQSEGGARSRRSPRTDGAGETAAATAAKPGAKAGSKPAAKADSKADAEAEAGSKAEAKAAATGSPEPETFEQALGRLEQVVDRLEGGDLELEAALADFEEGVRLTRQCAEQLDAAERRIEILTKQGDDWVARPFGDGEEIDDPDDDPDGAED